jgi:UPF0716 family protein affecting phage T7 exclusion
MKEHDFLPRMLAAVTVVPPGVVTTVLGFIVIKTAIRNAMRECN